MAFGYPGTVWPMPKKGQKRVAPQGLRIIVARNLRKLMLETEDLKTAAALGKAAKVGRKTVERMMEGTNASSMDTIEAVSVALNVRPWQLLVAGLDARDLPQLRKPEGVEAELYQRLDALSSAVQRLEQAGGPAYRRSKKAT